MRTRTRELAKPGIYGSVDDPKVVSAKDLREIVETFPDIGKAPVSLHGHWPDPRAPRLANVVALSYDENIKTLIGTVVEHEVLADAVDKGFYPDVSIGAKRRASDGKMYLHHLAYLGEDPPAIKNLVSDITKALDGKLEAPDGIAAADSGALVEIPSPRAAVLALSDGTESKRPKEAPAMTFEELQAKHDAAQAENLKLREKLTVLAGKYPEAVNLSDAEDPRVSLLVRQVRAGKRESLIRAAAGKVPKAKHGLLEALSESFSASESIELSDSGKTVKKSQYDVLADVLESIPSPVLPGKIDLSDGTDDKGGKVATVPFSKA